MQRGSTWSSCIKPKQRTISPRSVRNSSAEDVVSMRPGALPRIYQFVPTLYARSVITVRNFGAKLPTTGRIDVQISKYPARLVVSCRRHGTDAGRFFAASAPSEAVVVVEQLCVGLGAVCRLNQPSPASIEKRL